VTHFELYVEAMAELGTNTAPSSALVEAAQIEPTKPLDLSPWPGPAAVFVAGPFSMIERCSVHKLAAAFLALRLKPGRMISPTWGRGPAFWPDPPNLERRRSWHVAEDGGEVGPALDARRYGVLAPGQGRSRWSRRGAARFASP
jgi:hypothetical protein